MRSILDSALCYNEDGYSTIPTNSATKRPLIKWTVFQDRLPTKEEIHAWWEKYPKAMVAIVTGKISQICVVDCDSEEAIKRVDSVLPERFETPVAIYPRGGRHYYFACNDESILTRTAIFDCCDIRANGGVIVVPPSINAEGKQYHWLNGLELSRGILQPMPETLKALLDSATPREHPINNNKHNFSLGLVDTFVDSAKKLFENGKRDDELFHLALALRRAGESQEYILQVLINIADTWGEGKQVKWLQQKVKSAFEFEERKEKSLSEEIRDYVLSTSGVFLSTDVHRNLDLSTRVHKKNCSEVLRRLVAEGLIERYGNKEGCFRKIENLAEIIDFQNITEDSTLNIKLPFQIEDYVRILPKNIIAVAGEPNSGKTAFLLNVVRMNMHDHEIFYFSSEMGALEMRNRLSKFEIPLDQWRFKAVERASNFADVIKPDAINIIDYLEIHDEFYKIGGLIKDIFDRLKSGVAFIAIQKNHGTDYGLGGMRGLENPRLYLAMEANKIKIIKGKNWTNPEINPSGLECDFRLVQGCRFIMTSGWRQSVL